jgi:hypothetical protein
MRAQDLAILQNTNSYDGTFMQYKGFWKFNTTAFSAYYLHMKTYINSVNNMWLIEAIGYNYQYSTKVRSSWTFHKSGGGLYSLSYSYLGGGNGLSPSNIYLSGDGYVVIVGYSPGWGYCGFMLNGYNTADLYDQSGISNNRSPEIIAASFSGSNSPIY